MNWRLYWKESKMAIPVGTKVRIIKDSIQFPNWQAETYEVFDDPLADKIREVYGENAITIVDAYDNLPGIFVEGEYEVV